MQRENIPQKYRCRNLFQHFPSNACGAFPNRLTDRWQCASNAPTPEMVGVVHIIGERQSGAPAATVAQIPANPDRVKLNFACRTQNPMDSQGP